MREETSAVLPANVSFRVVCQSVTQKCLRKVWTNALHGAGEGEGEDSWGGRVTGVAYGDGQRALQPAAEPPDALPGWVSKPQSRGSFLAAFGMCGCLVIPHFLLTRRARISQNHAVIW